MIERSEYVLKDLGFYDVRVRHHELRVLAEGQQRCLARLEIGADEMPRLLENGTLARIAEALRQIGYLHVTLDMQGYRRGSGNEQIIPRSALGLAKPNV